MKFLKWDTLCFSRRGHREGGRLTHLKKFKTQFFRDIEDSFHEVTHLGLELHQFFSFQNISTNVVARAVQSYGRNGSWLASRLSQGQHFFCQICTHIMNNYWKFQGDYLILVSVRSEWLKVCCIKWTPHGQYYQKWP